MNGIPEGLVVNANSFAATGVNDVLRPVFGNLGPLPAEFRIVKEYIGSESEELGTEVERPVEVAMIHSDKFSKVPLRVAKDLREMRGKDGAVIFDERGKPMRKKIRSELSRAQEIALAPLYQQFKEQKDSTDTRITDWQAVREEERAFLAQIGIWTVEQLHAIPQHQRYQLGPNCDDLWARADRHIHAKDNRKREEATEEMLAVLEANKEMRKQNEEMQARLFEMEQRIAGLGAVAAPAKRGRPRKEIEHRGAA